jgi:putative ABC transport system ATP-binding protein
VPVVEASGVTKVYGSGDSTVEVLAGVDISVPKGQFLAVMGPSGSGKSTLMHIMAGLDEPTTGNVAIDGVDVGGLKDRQLTLLRREKVGFVFQFFNLLPMLSAEENILLPETIAGRKPDREWFATLVDQMGLADRLKHRPAELSGGQQQRVAIGRALFARPAVIFADEPTGNLDSKTSSEILDLLRRSVDDLGQTIVMVTHDARAAAMANRVVFLQDGRVVADQSGLDSETILDVMKGLE